MLLPPWQNPDDAGRSWEDSGVAVENIHLPPRIPGLFHLLISLRLVRGAVAARPDVVHLFKPKAYSGLAHWLLARTPRAGRPRLVVDADDWEGAGGWNEIGGYTPAQRRFFAWQERWGLTRADGVTVASHTLESLIWALGVPPGRVFYVPNGVGDESPVADGPPAASPERPVILLYTRFVEFPVSRVVEVFRRVREHVPGAHLLVVGEGLSGEEAQLMQMARESGMADAIDSVGWHGSDALPGYFSRASLAVYPFDDTLVNRAKCAVKLLELLAAGLPVVAEAVGQNCETISQGRTGWLVQPGDAASFSEAVVRLLEDASLRQRLGQAAARDVRQRFSWACLVGTVERAYSLGEVQR
jgi:glycosyltransferase involved in cell wall biosynthesis